MPVENSTSPIHAAIAVGRIVADRVALASAPAPSAAAAMMSRRTTSLPQEACAASGRRVMLWRNSPITQMAAVATRSQRKTGGVAANEFTGETYWWVHRRSRVGAAKL